MKIKKHKTLTLNLHVIIILIILTVFGLNLNAQELRCDVQIQKPQAQSGSEQLFQSMQRSVYEFMNTRKWTNIILKTMNVLSVLSL
ncbi:MAG: DUF4835 family protein [Chloroflexia bacterium]|nr:DUF4835 family protein [Chloroflexia bacterium]